MAGVERRLLNVERRGGVGSWMLEVRSLTLFRWFFLLIFLGFIPLHGQDDPLQNLSLSTILSFESEYVFRGEKQGDESFQPSLEAGHPLGSGDVYIGVWASQDIGGDASDEVNIYAGYSVPLSPIFAATAGFTYYWYPDEGATPNREKEPFLGVFADLPLQPGLFAFYNFTFEQFLVEASLSHRVKVAERSFLRGGLYAGAAQENDANSDQVPGEPRNSYVYFLTYLDLIYEINVASSASLGVRYSGREDSGYTDFLYWGASVSFGF
ncbi:MAG: TorF family putative porin [Verrucomicrobiota bacterium]